MRKSRFSLFDIFNLIFMLVLVVVMVYPFIYMAAIAFSSDTFVLKGEVSLWPKGFTMKVFESVLADPRIGLGYMNTLIYVTVGTVVSLAFTAMGAYSLSKKNMIWRKQFSMLLVFTMLFSGGIIPTFLIVKSLGIVNTMWAMILPSAISAYNFFVMRSFFSGIPEELEEAGKIDGMSDLGVFARIVLPLSKPVLATIGLFYAVGIWNNFGSALIYLRDSSLFPLQMILRSIVFQNAFSQEINQGGQEVIMAESVKYATILVSTVPILLVYPFIQKYFVKGALLGSVKG